MATAFPLDASSGAPSYTGQMLRDTLSALAGVAPSGRPLGATSGVRPGTPSTTVFLSGGSNFTWNVAAHSGVIDAETAAAAGPYMYATDGTDTGTITAANATNPRVDIIYVQINDNTQDGSGLESVVVGYLAGTPAASPVAPSPPTTRGIVLANINVPAVGGGNPAASWVAPTFGVSPWTAYTPALMNITIGNGTVRARYQQVGKTVTGEVLITAGSTTTFSAATLSVSLPVAPLNASVNDCIGSAFAVNGSSGTRNIGIVAVTAGSAFFVGPAAGNTWTSTVPFTWGTTATLSFSFMYEAA